MCDFEIFEYNRCMFPVLTLALSLNYGTIVIIGSGPHSHIGLATSNLLPITNEAENMM